MSYGLCNLTAFKILLETKMSVSFICIYPQIIHLSYCHTTLQYTLLHTLYIYWVFFSSSVKHIGIRLLKYSRDLFKSKRIEKTVGKTGSDPFSSCFGASDHDPLSSEFAPKKIIKLLGCNCISVV